MKKLLAVSIFAAAMVASQLAHAIPIVGEIAFSGSYTVNNPNLITASAFTSFSGVTVASSPTGAYAGTSGTATTFTPFSWDAFVAVTPAWSFAFGGRTYSFDFTSVSIDFNTATQLNISGNGLAKITGAGPTYDNTAGTWNITANTFGSVFSFSSGAVTPVPDSGATVALLGLALFGVYGLRRKLMVA